MPSAPPKSFADLGLRMKAGNRLGQSAHQFRRQFAGIAQPPEQGVLIEAAHDDDMVARGRRLVGAEAQIAVDALQDGAHFEIDLRARCAG